MPARKKTATKKTRASKVLAPGSTGRKKAATKKTLKRVVVEAVSLVNFATAKKLWGRIPKQLGKAIDFSYDLQQARLALEREADKLKELEREYEAHLLAELAKERSDGARGSRASFNRKEKTTYNVNWARFFPWAVKNDALDMVQHRINPSAVAERLKNREKGLAAIVETGSVWRGRPTKIGAASK